MIQCRVKLSNLKNRFNSKKTLYSGEENHGVDRITTGGGDRPNSISRIGDYLIQNRLLTMIVQHIHIHRPNPVFLKVLKNYSYRVDSTEALSPALEICFRILNQSLLRAILRFRVHSVHSDFPRSGFNSPVSFTGGGKMDKFSFLHSGLDVSGSGTGSGTDAE
jgi:hypothetical protein